MYASCNRSLRSIAAVTAGVMAACVGAPAADDTSAANQLVGVWSLVAVDPGGGAAVIEPSQPGLYIFATGHYSAVFAPGTEAVILDSARDVGPACLVTTLTTAAARARPSCDAGRG